MFKPLLWITALDRSRYTHHEQVSLVFHALFVPWRCCAERLRYPCFNLLAGEYLPEFP